MGSRRHTPEAENVPGPCPFPAASPGAALPRRDQPSLTPPLTLFPPAARPSEIMMVGEMLPYDEGQYEILSLVLYEVLYCGARVPLISTSGLGSAAIEYCGTASTAIGANVSCQHTDGRRVVIAYLMPGRLPTTFPPAIANPRPNSLCETVCSALSISFPAILTSCGIDSRHPI